MRLLALDVDGVLTDGGVYVLEDGAEFRRFDIKDGLALKQIMALGIQVAIISSGSCRSILFRAAKLGIDEVYIGVEDKLAVLEEICVKRHIALEEVCCIGDDLPDLAIIQRAGLSFAPADAVEEVKAAVHIVTRRSGGHGVIREFLDVLNLSSIRVEK